jgi:hypothetical protein
MWTYLNDETPKIKYTFLDATDELLEQLTKDIKNTGDKQSGTTNVYAHMTDWRTRLRSFDTLSKLVLSALDIDSKTVEDFEQWGLLYKDNDCAKPHAHDPADYAFVFYIDAPEGSGEIHFHDIDYTLTPQKNMLVAFEGTAIHEVYPNTISGIERVATAGNIVLSVDNVQKIR